MENEARIRIKAKNETRNAFKDVIRDVKRLKSELQTMTSGIGNVLSVGGMIGGASLIYLGKEAIETAASMETVENSIKAASETTEQGAKNIEFLRSTINELGLDVEAASKGYSLLLNNMLGSPMTQSNIDEIFKNISSAMRVIGLDAERQESTFRALGESISKGTFQAQELKTQLANALPRTMATMAETVSKKLGKKTSLSDVMVMMEKGQLKTSEFILDFSRDLKKAFSKGLDAALTSKSFNLQTLINQWKYLLRDIGDMLFDTGLIKGLRIVMMKVKEIFSQNKVAITENLKKAFDFIMKGFMWIINNFDAIVTAIKIITISFIALKTVMFAMSIMTLLANPLLAVGVAIAGLLISVPLLKDSFSEWRGEVREGVKELSRFEEILIMLDNLMGIFRDFGKMDGNPLYKLLAFIGQLFTHIYDLLVWIIAKLSWFLGMGEMMDKVANDNYAITKQWRQMMDEWANPDTSKDVYNPYTQEKMDLQPSIIPLNQMQTNFGLTIENKNDSKITPKQVNANTPNVSRGNQFEVQPVSNKGKWIW